jgi:hypothetical protein
VEVIKKKNLLILLGVIIIFSSCSTGEAASAAISQILGSSSQALLFLNCKAVSENEVEFEFSQPVTVKSLYFEPYLEIVSIEDGKIVKVRLEESLTGGIQFTADLLAEDTDRNTINILVPFRSRNNRMPALVINEIRTENSNPRAEFIEFKMKSAGNLGAMRLFILGNTNATRETIYEFKPIEVKEGEYVTLHLRTLEADCRDEYGDDLTESGGRDSSPTGRDLWMPGNTKLIHKTSVIYVLDQDDRVLDAVMMSENPDSWWIKDYFADAAYFLHQQGAWKAPDGKIGSPADAIITGRTTNTRTICRDETVENSKTSADWYITVSSGATPGRINNPNRFVN